MTTRTETRIPLRILATTDVHMHLTGWDALLDQDMAGRGMDVLATRIAHFRKTAQGPVILLDNGDALQGTPVGDVCADVADTHPWPAIINALDYDAVGLGNHDFDFGLPFMQTVMNQIACPVLCANCAPSVDGVQPAALLDLTVAGPDDTVLDLRVGVTAALPPQTSTWNLRCLDGALSFSPGVAAIRAQVDGLRDAGADVVVVLGHTGLTDGLDTTGENFGAAIASDVPGIDALILGHTHLSFPGPDHAGFAGVDAGDATVHDVPAIMPLHAAQELGVIDLQLVHDPDGWRVVDHAVMRDAPPPDTVRDAGIRAIAAPALQQTRARMDKAVASLSSPVHTYFSMLRSGPSEALMARAMITAAQSAAEGTDLAALPTLASVAPACLGGRAGPRNYVDAPAGDLLERHVAMMCPYPNTVWAAVLTGAELWDWADRGLSYFAPRAGTLSSLVNPGAPAFNFDAIHGLEAEIDPFAPGAFDAHGHRVQRDATRIRSLTRNGDPVRADERFLLAMTSYRGAGGGNFPGIGPQTRTLRTQIELREALRQTVRTKVPAPGSNASVWRFAPTAGEACVIETAPQAEAMLDEIAGYVPEALGVNDAGFLEVQVRL